MDSETTERTIEPNRVALRSPGESGYTIKALLLALRSKSDQVDEPFQPIDHREPKLKKPMRNVHACSPSEKNPCIKPQSARLPAALSPVLR